MITIYDKNFENVFKQFEPEINDLKLPPHSMESFKQVSKDYNDLLYYGSSILTNFKEKDTLKLIKIIHETSKTITLRFSGPLWSSMTFDEKFKIAKEYADVKYLEEFHRQKRMDMESSYKRDNSCYTIEDKIKQYEQRVSEKARNRSIEMMTLIGEDFDTYCKRVDLESDNPYIRRFYQEYSDYKKCGNNYVKWLIQLKNSRVSNTEMYVRYYKKGK